MESYSSNCSINFSNSSLADVGDWEDFDDLAEVGVLEETCGDFEGIDEDLEGTCGDFEWTGEDLEGTCGDLIEEVDVDLPELILADRRSGDEIFELVFEDGNDCELGIWKLDDECLCGITGWLAGTPLGMVTWIGGNGLLALADWGWGSGDWGLFNRFAVISNTAHFSFLVTYSCSINGIWSTTLTSSLPGNTFLGLFESTNYI